MNLTKASLEENAPVVFAQITDCHLFANQQDLHHGHNVFENLTKVLFSISQKPNIEFIVFTGDLTQDHSEQSYQNFVTAVEASAIIIPIYYLAGNHDEPELLAKYFSAPPFLSDKTIDHKYWQIQLIDSKSKTPAGYVSDETLVKLQKQVNLNKQQMVMMHHHPIDVGYFIDKHGLQNKQEFWQAIEKYDNINAISCGHVHGAMQLSKQLTGANNSVTVYTCPATSIQFDPKVDGVAALALGPAYRIFYLSDDAKLSTSIIRI